jgi:hypothetical protein
MDYGLFFFCIIHKEGLCPISGDINRLMMINNILLLLIYIVLKVSCLAKGDIFLEFFNNNCFCRPERVATTLTIILNVINQKMALEFALISNK